MDLEKQQIEREKFQEECVALSKQHKHLLIEAATGVGKGLAVIKCIAASSSPKKWLIVVPEILQIENYKQDLVKHNYEWLLEGKIYDIICYASLSKYRDMEFNLHLNEVHRLSDAREEDVSTFKFDQIISDSATIPEEIKFKLWHLWPFHPVKLSLKDAIDKDILPKPKFHIIDIELDNKIKRNKKIIKKKTYYFTDLSTAKSFDKQIETWNNRKQEFIESEMQRTGGYVDYSKFKWIDNKIIRIGGVRKKFIAGLKSNKARELIDSLGDRRLAIFCGSVEQSEELGGELSLNSSRGKKHNLSALERFNNKETNKIYFNKMGREGMNFSSIDGIVIIQLDSGKDDGLSLIQKSGRGMRADDPEIWILYCKNTHDEVFLKNALKNIDKQYINYI